MSTKLQIALTVYGQPITGIVVPIGSSASWTFDVEDPQTRAALDLTGCTVAMSMSSLDIAGKPAHPPLVTWPGTISNTPTDGVVTVAWLPADTSTLSPGSYAVDAWVTDGSGNRLQIMATSIVQLASASTLPT